MNPDLSVVILSWNTCDLLRDCLRSVFAEPTGLRMEVFVADNASSDPSVAMVRAEFPQVRLIENRENLGFARANNQVFPSCRAEAILLLNSDTVVRGDALRVLLDTLRARPEVGAAGPRLLHPRVQMRVLGAGHQASLWRVFTHSFFLSYLFPRVPWLEGTHFYVGAHDDRVREAGWVSGACLLVRREVIETVGPMSEEWFMYVEDQEWCARMLAAGWKVLHVPDAVVEHYLSASTEKNAAVSLMPITAGRDYYIKRARPSRLRLLLFDFFYCGGHALRAAGYYLFGLTTSPPHRAMWFARARTYRRYARAAAPRP